MYHFMNVDIETYSSVDITKAGAYAYAESPDFEILHIGYKIDDGPVKVIDLTKMFLTYGNHTCGQVIAVIQKEVLEEDYSEFWNALTRSDYIKTAYNANFERTCLSTYFKIPMPPEQWRCTAVHAATLGLPGNLAGVGAALGLPEDKQKDKIGKALINYFCKPCRATKTNGGRTRNLPCHDKEKWEQFVEYNRQDVITESAIRDMITRYRISDSEQQLWELDQDMNDRRERGDGCWKNL